MFRYALRLAAIPVLAVLGLGIGRLLGGAVLVEIVFARPGLGTLVFDAIGNRDYPVVQGACWWWWACSPWPIWRWTCC